MTKIQRCLPPPGESGIVYVAYSPLGGSGRVDQLKTSEPIRDIARDHGATPVQVALAWLRHPDSTVVPIVGTRRPEAIVEAAGAAALELDADEVALIANWAETRRSADSAT